MIELRSSLTRSRTLYLLALFLLAGLSLRPAPLVERAFDWLSAPTRLMGELGAPLGWLRARRVHADEASLLERGAVAQERSEALLRDEQQWAKPTRVQLTAGRRLVHGEVARHLRGRLDEVEVRLATTRGIEVGMPVVTGDHYLGRVSRLHPAGSGMVTVSLATGRDFYVGAEIVPERTERFRAPEPCQLVVGGLAPRRERGERAHYLAVHTPTRREIGGGEVRVREPAMLNEAHARLAQGFVLGKLEVDLLPGGHEERRVRPAVDFESGLGQVIVLAPLSSGVPVEELVLDTFDTRRWIAVRAITTADLCAGRESRRIAAGSLAGLQPGSALAFGAHFLGRVHTVGPFSSDARLMGDVGLRLTAVARVEGDEVPRALGELVSLGRRPEDGSVRFRWEARLPVRPEGADPAQAELFTGSGIEGVPRGLYLGSSLLPSGGGVHELLVHQDPAARELSKLWVWRGTRRAGGAP